MRHQGDVHDAVIVQTRPDGSVTQVRMRGAFQEEALTCGGETKHMFPVSRAVNLAGAEAAKR